MGANQNAISLANLALSRADAAYRSTQVANPFYGILPQNGGFGQNPTIQRGDLLRPDAIFGDMTNNLSQWGRYRYDALQTKFEKRVLSNDTAGAFTWVMSYTFSKAYEQNHFLNNWNYANEPVIKELDNTDKPHMIAFSGIWDLPMGRGRGRLQSSNPTVNKLIGGWQFDWIYTYTSGYPTGLWDRDMTCSDYHATNQDRDHWFNNNKSCYPSRAPNTIRVVPDRFSNIRNPAIKQLNIVLEKTTQIHERFKFVLRGEAFNITNTPGYAGPNTDPNSDRFGRLPQDQQNWPRLIQLSGKFHF
jgi:hypothetical protein